MHRYLVSFYRKGSNTIEEIFLNRRSKQEVLSYMSKYYSDCTIEDIQEIY